MEFDSPNPASELKQITGRVNFNTESTEEAQRAQRISDTKGLSDA